MGQHRTDKPEVLAPPPLFFLVPLVVGLALQFALPVHFLPAGWLQMAAGIPIIVVAGILVATAFGTLTRAKTDLVFKRPTTTVVMRGPYRLSRNPIYLAGTLLLVGVALAVNTLWLLALLPAVVLLVTFGAVIPEERFLEREFGDEYLEYRSRVRRWL